MGMRTVAVYSDADATLPFVREADVAIRIGPAAYPVMIKPVAGGGGIGMQALRDERALREALARARRLATASFGDERLLLERLIERPRHVEVQVVANDHGNVVSYLVRDCSAQRRHQKIVEESPGPSLDGGRQVKLAAAARAIAREAGYRNAGTVEFILDKAGDFYFLEVNARLQVEHPVTEVVCGVDLVEQQLRVALGEQGLREWTRSGDAVEARIYAEDPGSGFLPSTGWLAHVRWPDGVRVDAGYGEGDTVTRHYDPLLAKVIAHGADRTAALDALAKALDDTEVLGVRTNLGFLRALVAHPAMREGRVHTDLVEHELSQLVPAPQAAPDQAYAIAAASVVEAARSSRDPWSARGPWRLGEGSATTVG